MNESTLVQVRDGAVAMLILNRPDTLNALNVPCIKRNLNVAEAGDLADSLDLEAHHLTLTRTTEDHREAVSAFLGSGRRSSRRVRCSRKQRSVTQAGGRLTQNAM